MMFTIVRISVDDTNRTPMPEAYSDEAQAVLALTAILADYAQHSKNGEHGYWWARDDKGHSYRFVIER